MTRLISLLTVLGLWAVLAQAQPITRYPLDEGTGTTSADLIGTNTLRLCQSGTCPQQGPTWISGRIGFGLSFDGTNDHADTTAMVLNPSATNFTAMAWIRLTTTGINHTFLQQLDGTGTGRGWLFVGTTSLLSTFLGNVLLAGTTTLTTDIWYHVAVTRNGSTVAVYLNGVEENTATRTVESATGVLRLGSSKALNNWLMGAMDDVQVFDTALSEAEIAAIAGGQRRIRNVVP